MRLKRIAVLVTVALFAGGIVASAQAQEKKYSTVELRGLDKVTARSLALEGNLGTPLEFSNLSIVAKNCWVAPTDKRPEHAALLEITEMISDKGPQVIFYGWMFASSPALSALEHPVYDITMIACKE